MKFDATDYRPSQAVLIQLNRVTLIMTLGPSAVGKTTLMRASGIPMVIGDASRAPRSGEQNGIDYNFRTEADMLADVRGGEYVQIAVGAEGDLKGTKASSFPKSGTATFAVIASAIETFRSLGFARTETAVIVPENFEVWMQRLKQYGISDKLMQRRLDEAHDSLTFALNDPLAKFVLNDTIAAGARRLNQVAAGEMPEDSMRAHQIAVDLLAQLK